MSKLWGFLAGLGGVIIALFSVFLAGQNSEKNKQARATLKRKEKNQKVFKDVEAKHEGFQRKNDLESARQSFLSS